MPVITAITRNVKNTSRCSVFVDGAFFAACPIDVAGLLGLRKGLEMTQALEADLRMHDRRMVLKQKAWRYATYKPRTVHQVQTKLQSLDCTTEESDEIIEWLKQFGQLDDHAYAERFIEASKMQKPMSTRLIRQKLTQKGISATVIDAAIARYVTDDEQLIGAVAVAQKKLSSLGRFSQQEQREKLQRFLHMRGYSWPVIKNVLGQLSLGVLLCLLGIAFTRPATAQADKQVRTVDVTLSIIDAITERPVTTAMVELITLDSLTSAIGGRNISPARNGVFQTTLHENQRLRFETTAHEYFTHNQTLSIRNLDSNVHVTLTVRLYPRNTAIARVLFIRSTDSLNTGWLNMVERIGRELSTQSFNITLRGFQDRNDMDKQSLPVLRTQKIRDMLISQGVSPTRIAIVYDELPPLLPLLSTMSEHPKSQMVVIEPSAS